MGGLVIPEQLANIFYLFQILMISVKKMAGEQLG